MLHAQLDQHLLGVAVLPELNAIVIVLLGPHQSSKGLPLNHAFFFRKPWSLPWMNIEDTKDRVTTLRVLQRY